MLRKWAYKAVSAVLMALFVVGCLKINSLAAGTEISAASGSDNQSVAVTVQNPELAGKSASIICYAPGWNKDAADLDGNLKFVVVLDQVELDAAGSVTKTYPLRDSLPAGIYTLAVGSADGGAQATKEFTLTGSGVHGTCTHPSTDIVKKKEATCTAEGYTGDKVCKDCKAVIEVGKKTGKAAHKFGVGVVTKEPTEREDGIRTYTCTVCKATKIEKIPRESGSGSEGGNGSSAPLPQKGSEASVSKANAKIKVTKPGKIVNGKVTGAEVQYMKPVKRTAKVTVPDTVSINGISYKVTSIAPNAFKNDKNITQVSIGNNVKVIGDNAFCNCKKLKKVKIGKAVSVIGKSAFANCPKLSSVTLGATKDIGSKAFYKCVSLKKITLPSGVTKIGKQAFYGCKKLRAITIKSKKLKSVGSKAITGIHKNAVIKVPASSLKKYRKLFKSSTGYKRTMKIKR